MNKFRISYRCTTLATALALLTASLLLAGSRRAYAASTLFLDNFPGPTLSSAWQASLPTMNQENAVFGPQPATYQGAPAYSFQTLGGSSVLRVTDTKTELQRRGWSTSSVFTPSSFHYEVRFNSLTQSAATSIDGFIEVGLLDASDSSRYDLIGPFGGSAGTDRQFTTGSSIDNNYTAPRYSYQDNTWYRLVLDAAPGQNIRASLEDDTGTELIGQSFSHGANAFGSGFRLILAQSMGEPPSPYPQDVAIDYASLTTVPEPGSASLACCGLVYWAARRRSIRRRC